MSREDPQFKLRMPVDLRDQAEQAAKTAGRSLNAELVARLEASFLSMSSSEKLMTAARAEELASMARAGIPEKICKRKLKAINRAAELGRTSTSVDLQDLGLGGGLRDEKLDGLTASINSELINTGCKVEWDGGYSMWIRL